MMSLPQVSRRFVLGGGAACLLAPPGGARAATVVKGSVIGKNGWLFLVWDDPRKADAQRMKDVTGTITAAIGLLRAAKIEVVIPLTPAKARVYPEFLPDDFTFSPEAEKRYGAALAVLRQSGALVPDLATFFAGLRKAQPGTDIFYKTDTHWTAFGAENAAAEIGRRMNETLHLPASAQPGAKLGPAVTQVHTASDLAMNLPLADRTQHPDESFAVHLPLAAQGKSALIEDDNADVVVIGNSYMQPKYNFAPALSSTINRPVGLVWKIHTVGPYRTMLNYLGSDAFKRQKPKVIVWNFHEIDMELPIDSTSAWPQDAMADDVFLGQVRAAVKA